MGAKERIAEAALAEVPEDGAILIDAGTTTGLLAQILPTDRELTVVTNSLAIASALSSWTNLTLMMVGGRLQRHSLAAVDEWSLRVLWNIYVDVAFVGTMGLSVARGLTTSDEALATVKRAMIACARRTVLLADHTKIDNNQPAAFGELADLDIVITDSGVDPIAAKEIATAGPQVIAA
ncbi:D-beta-D-heptose 1-phosphate adenosyltransferase [Actinophytocola sp.]|jgi:DeoR family fructose operon transcriptional repressor|uniref:DeoR/GlpR family DNA-binding transcription regulator n=1 Tax=Actinophytocola sp. TaxID=1872138 RepID=UPI002ED88440